MTKPPANKRDGRKGKNATAIVHSESEILDALERHPRRLTLAADFKPNLPARRYYDFDDEAIDGIFRCRQIWPGSMELAENAACCAMRRHLAGGREVIFEVDTQNQSALRFCELAIAALMENMHRDGLTEALQEPEEDPATEVFGVTLHARLPNHTRPVHLSAVVLPPLPPICTPSVIGLAVRERFPDPGGLSRQVPMWAPNGLFLSPAPVIKLIEAVANAVDDLRQAKSEGESKQTPTTLDYAGAPSCQERQDTLGIIAHALFKKLVGALDANTDDVFRMAVSAIHDMSGSGILRQVCGAEVSDYLRESLLGTQRDAGVFLQALLRGPGDKLFEPWGEIATPPRSSQGLPHVTPLMTDVALYVAAFGFHVGAGSVVVRPVGSQVVLAPGAAVSDALATDEQLAADAVGGADEISSKRVASESGMAAAQVRRENLVLSPVNMPEGEIGDVLRALDPETLQILNLRLSRNEKGKFLTWDEVAEKFVRTGKESKRYKGERCRQIFAAALNKKPILNAYVNSQRKQTPLALDDNPDDESDEDTVRKATSIAKFDTAEMRMDDPNKSSFHFTSSPRKPSYLANSKR